MESNYIPIPKDFRRTVEALVSGRKSVHLNYVTDLRELLSATAIIKELRTKNQAEFAVLSTGEEIRLDHLVRVDNVLAPGYEGYDFGNSCAL
jgi:Rho-binding antiterminator